MGDVFLGGVVSFRFDGEEVGAAEVEVDEDAAALEGDLGRSKNIFLVSGSVLTLIGEVVVGSSRGEKRDAALLRGVVGGVPSSCNGAGSKALVPAEGGREGLASSKLWFSAIILSTSPSSGVRSLVRVCLFFGVVGLDAGAGAEDKGDAVTLSVVEAGATAAAVFVIGAVAASFVDFALADRLLLERAMLALPAAKCAAMPLLGAILGRV